MKFSNGHWLLKKGCDCFSPAEVYFSKIEENKVTILAPTHHISHRGDTLGGANLTIEITAPMKEVIGIKTYHYKGVVAKGPEFELDNISGGNMCCQDLEDKLVIS